MENSYSCLIASVCVLFDLITIVIKAHEVYIWLYLVTTK